MSRASEAGIYRGDSIIAHGHIIHTYWPERYQSLDWEIAKKPTPSLGRQRMLMRQKGTVKGTVLGWTQRWIGTYSPAVTPSYNGWFDDCAEHAFLYNTTSVNVLAVAPVVATDVRYKPVIYVLPEDVISNTRLQDSKRVDFFMDFQEVYFDIEYYSSEVLYVSGQYKPPTWMASGLWYLDQDAIERRVHCPEVENPIGGMQRKCLYRGYKLQNCIPLGYTHRATGVLQLSGHTEKWRKWELGQKTWHKVLVVSPESSSDRYSPEVLAFPKDDTYAKYTETN